MMSASGRFSPGFSLVLCSLWLCHVSAQIRFRTKPEVLRAEQGVFFKHVYQVEPSYTQGVDLQSTAAIDGRPDLPAWLHATDSGREFLFFGVPEPRAVSVNITVSTNNRATHSTKFKTFELIVAQKPSHPVAARVSFVVRGQPLESFVADDNLRVKLEKAVLNAFGRDGVKPIVSDLQRAGSRSTFVTVSSGNSARFDDTTELWFKGLIVYKQHCNLNDRISFNRFFEKDFDVDWCQFKIGKKEVESSIGNGHLAGRVPPRTDAEGNILRSEKLEQLPPLDPDYRPFRESGLTRSYFMNWVLVAVVPLTLLLLIILLLSAVFFGCREGQHWRDHKTPQPQLAEYVSLRRSQSTLRHMSSQRAITTSEDEADPLINMTDIQATGHHVNWQGTLGKKTVAQAAAEQGDDLTPYDDTVPIDPPPPLPADNLMEKESSYPIDDDSAEDDASFEEDSLQSATNEDLRARKK